MQICHRHKFPAVHSLTFLFVTSKQSAWPGGQSTSLIPVHLFPTSLQIKYYSVVGCLCASPSNLALPTTETNASNIMSLQLFLCEWLCFMSWCGGLYRSTSTLHDQWWETVNWNFLSFHLAIVLLQLGFTTQWVKPPVSKDPPLSSCLLFLILMAKRSGAHTEDQRI